MVTTRFQGNIGRRPACLTSGLAQGIDLGMRHPGLEVKSLPDDPSRLDQHTTHAWIGVRRIAAMTRQAQGLSHMGEIYSLYHCRRNRWWLIIAF
jgi:hypothetical protein